VRLCPKQSSLKSCQQLKKKKKRKEGLCSRPREEKNEKKRVCVIFSWKLLEKSKTKCKIERVWGN
jgi:hypothetical protein